MTSKKKSNIFHYLKKRDAKRFSIFIAIAFLFLIFSKLSSDYKQYIHLKIELTGAGEEIVIKDDSLTKINALVEAKGFALAPYIFKKSKTIVLDVNKDVIIKAEAYVIEVEKNNFLIEDQLGSSYKILSLKPDSLVIPYSKRASKYVPITLNSNIEFGPGFDIKGKYTFNADSAKIVGPEDRIKDINFISTKKLELGNVNTNIDETVELNSINGLEIFPNSINVTAEVKRFTEGKIEIPVTIINKPENLLINYFPKTVTISYYVDLENYNSIKIDDFKVVCDYNQIEGGQAYFVPQIVKSPKYIKRIFIKQKRIDYIKL